MIRQSRFHRGRDAQRRMDATEVVVRKMQIHSSLKILQFPRERIGQTCEAAKLHSDRQVLPFNVAGRNVIGIGVTRSDLGYNLRDLSWGVAFISLLAIVSIEFRKLREICIAAEGFLDCLPVKDVRIGGELDAMVRDSAPNVPHEGLSVRAGCKTEGVVDLSPIPLTSNRFKGRRYNQGIVEIEEDRPQVARYFQVDLPAPRASNR